MQQHLAVLKILKCLILLRTEITPYPLPNIPIAQAVPVAPQTLFLTHSCAVLDDRDQGKSLQGERPRNESNAAAVPETPWCCATRRFRDIINSIALLHQHLQDLPTIATFLDEGWVPFPSNIHPSLVDAIASLVTALEENLAEDLSDHATQLRTSMAQAARMCGVELHLPRLENDEDREG